MKTLLVTGFEPFGGEEINPSWQAVSMLPCEIGEYKLFKLLLPVVFGEAAAIAIKTAMETSADAILCVGQAGGRSAVTPEFLGINVRYAKIPDNKGNVPKDEPIIPGGPAARFVTLPARKMTEAIITEGIAAEVSYSAGTYVCNDLIYTLLSHFEESETRVGFIHIPYSDEQKKSPSMNINDIIRGLVTAIKSLDL